VVTVEEDGRPIAFVQVGGETFQKRDLALGIRDGNWVQVLSGIAEGERVVTKGAYAVRLASVSSAIPAHGRLAPAFRRHALDGVKTGLQELL